MATLHFKPMQVLWYFSPYIIFRHKYNLFSQYDIDTEVTRDNIEGVNAIPNAPGGWTIDENRYRSLEDVYKSDRIRDIPDPTLPIDEPPQMLDPEVYEVWKPSYRKYEETAE